MNTGRNQSLRETFARLYDENMPKVYRYMYYRVNSQPLAEDLTSAVFEKALVNFAKYDSERASFATWIFAIAKNTIADHYRSMPKVKTVPIEDAIQAPSREPGPQELAEDGEEKQLLRSCIGHLAEDEQELIRLKFAMEMTNREIARTTGLSESNVGVRLFRIIRRLKDQFQETQRG